MYGTLHSIYMEHYIPYMEHYIPYMEHYIPYYGTLHSMYGTLHSIYGTLHSMYGTLHSIYGTLHYLDTMAHHSVTCNKAHSINFATQLLRISCYIASSFTTYNGTCYVSCEARGYLNKNFFSASQIIPFH